MPYTHCIEVLHGGHVACQEQWKCFALEWKFCPIGIILYDEVKDSSITGYRLVDMEILCSVFSLLRCADCGSFTLKLTENQFNRSGCASCLRLFCKNCGWRSEFYSSKKQTQSFEVNRRLVYTMRSLGKRHGGAKKFCTLMNMPPPSAAKPFKKSSNTITKSIKTIAKKSMSDAAAEIRSAQNAENNDIVNCPVSCDGTWQKRGFSSPNGCVSVISIDTGRVLDLEAMSKSLQAMSTSFPPW